MRRWSSRCCECGHTRIWYDTTHRVPTHYGNRKNQGTRFSFSSQSQVSGNRQNGPTISGKSGNLIFMSKSGKIQKKWTKDQKDQRLSTGKSQEIQKNVSNPRYTVRWMLTARRMSLTCSWRLFSRCRLSKWFFSSLSFFLFPSFSHGGQINRGLGR
jgi:hypothetical protein